MNRPIFPYSQHTDQQRNPALEPFGDFRLSFKTNPLSILYVTLRHSSSLSHILMPILLSPLFAAVSFSLNSSEKLSNVRALSGLIKSYNSNSACLSVER